jgi:hypothetical protein
MKVDFIKEEIGYAKMLFVVSVTIFASLFGFIFVNFKNISLFSLTLCVIANIILMFLILYCNKRMREFIKLLKNL